MRRQIDLSDNTAQNCYVELLCRIVVSKCCVELLCRDDLPGRRTDHRFMRQHRVKEQIVVLPESRHREKEQMIVLRKRRWKYGKYVGLSGLEGGYPFFR